MSTFSISYKTQTDLLLSIEIFHGDSVNNPRQAQTIALTALNTRKNTLIAQPVILKTGLIYANNQYTYYIDVLWLKNSQGKNAAANFITSGENINLR